MSFWIDSHAHMVDECYQAEFDVYMQRAKEANVGRVLVICLNFAEVERAFELKEQYPKNIEIRNED
jgi:TatD DNase family protein